VHADRLEAACGRMLAVTAAYRARDDLRQLAGARDRLHAAGRHDGARDAAGVTLFAQFADHVADLIVRRAREPGGGAFAPRRIHAHVERTVGLEAEAARGVVELWRRHAEVEENPCTATSVAMCRDQ